eukprot:scaffold301_cov16-Tisochrysis_lutea.AAC.1
MQTKRDANQGGRLGQHLQRNASKGKYKAAGKCKAGRCQASGRCKSKGSAHDSTCKELQAKGFEKLQGKQHREMLRLREMKIKGIAQTHALWLPQWVRLAPMGQRTQVLLAQ